eukprot:362942-Chlamydomonas_euryale.AAC.11
MLKWAPAPEPAALTRAKPATATLQPRARAVRRSLQTRRPTARSRRLRTAPRCPAQTARRRLQRRAAQPPDGKEQRCSCFHC